MWSESQLNLPAADPGARFYRYADNRDVLVTYDELRERNDKIRRRAFFFKANLKRLELHKKPRFVSPAVAGDVIIAVAIVAVAGGVVALYAYASGYSTR